MKAWTQALRDAAISGTCASLGSTAALTLCGIIERGRAVAPNNAPSQWVWGEQEAYERRATVRHTVVGYVIHHLISISWALVHEKWIAAPAGRAASVTLSRGAFTAALACLVDYRLTPRRFRPGFEKHLSRSSLAVAYAAFALGLAVTDFMQPAPRRAEKPGELPRKLHRAPPRPGTRQAPRVSGYRKNQAAPRLHHRDE